MRDDDPGARAAGSGDEAEVGSGVRSVGTPTARYGSTRRARPVPAAGPARGPRRPAACAVPYGGSGGTRGRGGGR